MWSTLYDYKKASNISQFSNKITKLPDQFIYFTFCSFSLANHLGLIEMEMDEGNNSILWEILSAVKSCSLEDDRFPLTLFVITLKVRLHKERYWIIDSIERIRKSRDALWKMMAVAFYPFVMFSHANLNELELKLRKIGVMYVFQFCPCSQTIEYYKYNANFKIIVWNLANAEQWAVKYWLYGRS